LPPPGRHAVLNAVWSADAFLGRGESYRTVQVPGRAPGARHRHSDCSRATHWQRRGQGVPGSRRSGGGCTLSAGLRSLCSHLGECRVPGGRPHDGANRAGVAAGGAGGGGGGSGRHAGWIWMKSSLSNIFICFFLPCCSFFPSTSRCLLLISPWHFHECKLLVFIFIPRFHLIFFTYVAQPCQRQCTTSSSTDRPDFFFLSFPKHPTSLTGREVAGTRNKTSSR
jgi:hypothetical protein